MEAAIGRLEVEFGEEDPSGGVATPQVHDKM
jgi:hypothetical protein